MGSGGELVGSVRELVGSVPVSNVASAQIDGSAGSRLKGTACKWEISVTKATRDAVKLER